MTFGDYLQRRRTIVNCVAWGGLFGFVFPVSFVLEGTRQSAAVQYAGIFAAGAIVIAAMMMFARRMQCLRCHGNLYSVRKQIVYGRKGVTLTACPHRGLRADEQC